MLGDAFGCVAAKVLLRSMGIVTVNTEGLSMDSPGDDDDDAGCTVTAYARLAGRKVVCPLRMMLMSVALLTLELEETFESCCAKAVVMFLRSCCTLDSGGGGGYLPMYRGSVLNMTMAGVLNDPDSILSRGSAVSGGAKGVYRLTAMTLVELAGTSTLVDAW